MSVKIDDTGGWWAGGGAQENSFAGLWLSLIDSRVALSELRTAILPTTSLNDQKPTGGITSAFLLTYLFPRMMKWMIGCVAALLWLSSRPAAAYSVLTHQANIDSAWQRSLVPLLQGRYPGATDDQLNTAKSYAYGGSILQDMGYYPFGSELFTNLTHYVRSGDFVRALLDEAQDRNEYAFALGALAHYAADISGHPEGTNRAMPSVYPELGARFGPSITYEQAPVQHTQLEFAFDVVQVAAGRYRSSDYQRFIGFEVSKPVLERAFLKTYGLELGQVVFNVDLAIGSFRFAVRSLIPIASRAAWQSQRKEIRRLSPRARRREYVYRQSERAYRREFGTTYEHPGTGARMLSYVVRVLPKIGPLKPFAFTLPTPEAQELFKASFSSVMQNYRRLASQEPRAVTTPGPRLPNTDFDTGQPTKLGEYALTDETYGEWLRKLADKKFEYLTPAQQQHLLSFFDSSRAAPVDEEEKKKYQQTQEALHQLRTAKTR
ncbi:zinc dependent phospholipase C family protein [Hymenobacter weizhouensis]|uniref:zinc dependent phospholipase C family protein n=1 Tax=Hymenobacter sp. YIM 151500-1 TaxID=2987689 RepID=UPI0022267A41|nr:zinc dependent phospholipase C family protein [Hymenobacter sp. YIM 151500-1]UYZ65100.1 zinc dependent phospholipase C family protein [Hymenobacter sp. YIM 151500-1]